MPVTESHFLAVAGTVNITPAVKLPLAGYAGRDSPFERVADPLEANVLLLRDGHATAAFVSLDLLYPGLALREQIEVRLAGRIATDSLFVAASHTHFAPATDRHLPRLGVASLDYVTFVADRVGSLLTTLLDASASPANITHRRGLGSHAVNRRLPVFGLGRDFPFLKTRWQMRPNFSAAHDETIDVLSVTDEAGAVRAVCWCYACHPVCFYDIHAVSADFPGTVRNALRRAYGAIPVLYLQGFSGDLRPCCVEANRTNAVGRRQPPAFAALDAEGWNYWSGSVASSVVAAASSAGSVLRGRLSLRRRSLAWDVLGPSSGGRPLTTHEVSFGDSLSIFGVSAELANSYVGMLQACRNGATIAVGCIDGVSGYIPTSAMVREGGYEAQGFMRLFGVSGRYRSDISEIVTRSVLSP